DQRLWNAPRLGLERDRVTSERMLAANAGVLLAIDYALALSEKGKVSSPLLPASSSSCSCQLSAVTRPRYVFRWRCAVSKASWALFRLLPTFSKWFWKKSNDFCALASSARLFSKRLATSYHLCTSAMVCSAISRVLGETGNTCCAFSQSASSRLRTASMYRV